ncbi:hypothetical protein [Methylobacterium sp. WL9]|uniref:hypothetical protein n=1 Tax=Methylobacterium sp. WL9 TaxID=2603898 RepID=UPI0011CC4E95|nr:hypothetical protein [Methylobacterium sp. WL9]TXN20995.1 hypothetical protein FV217_15995 [Methylobacterium sp. WL9]
MSTSKSKLIDWEEVEQDFESMRAAYIPYYVMMDEDLERCKLSDATYGMIESNHIQKIKSWDYVSVVDWEKRERLVEIANSLGPIGNANDDGMPKTKTKTGLWLAVEASIKSRSLTHDFIKSWAGLHYNYGAYLELYVGNRDYYYSHFHQIMMANSDTTIIQRHWFAHWIIYASRDEHIDRKKATEKMVELVEEIGCAVRAPWGPYPVEWFSCLLQTEKNKMTGRLKRNGTLKSTYTKLTDRELMRMIEHPLITSHVLPPLSAKKFRLL